MSRTLKSKAGWLCIAGGIAIIGFLFFSGDSGGNCSLNDLDVNASTSAFEICEGSRGIVRLSGGIFTMGDSSGDGHYSERPAHTVRLSPFGIQTCEVTREEYVRFLNDVDASFSPLFVIEHGLKVGEVRAPEYCVKVSGHSIITVPSESVVHQDGVFKVDGDPKTPIVVTWFGATLYCKWIGGRLPTAAQFEYAAKAGSTSAYASPLEYACAGDETAGKSSERKLKAVGSYAANAWGIYDMMGNAPEWCLDWDAAYNYDLEYWRYKAQRSDYWAKRFSRALKEYDSLANPYYQSCIEDHASGMLDPQGADKPGKWYDSKIVRGGWLGSNDTRRGGWMLGEKPTGRYSARNRAQPREQAAGFRVVFPLDR